MQILSAVLFPSLSYLGWVQMPKKIQTITSRSLKHIGTVDSAGLTQLDEKLIDRGSLRYR
jgi:hypothetical protein